MTTKAMALEALMRCLAEKRIPRAWVRTAAARYRNSPEVWALVLNLAARPALEQPRATAESDRRARA